MVRALRQRTGFHIAAWRPEEGDAVLYVASALFAGLTAKFSNIALYRQWGDLAFGPYLIAGIVSAFIARPRAVGDGDEVGPGALAVASPQGEPIVRRSWGAARIWVFIFVLTGATLVPLSLEVAWRTEGNPTAHVQPEAITVEQAAARAARGKDPYREVTNSSGHVLVQTKGEPTYENFFPYLPLMTIFGLPSSTKESHRLTDARIFFSLFTFLVVAYALVLCRGPSEAKVRTLQVLTVLPTAALPLATGGDDMPIVALLLLAMVLAQRRRPGWSGVVLGIVSAMKFTAWPLAALALFAAKDRNGRRAPWRMALGMAVVAGPVVLPFILNGPYAFFDNVVLFPLGLSGVASPAASALPGHLIVTAFPSLHRIFPLTVGLIGGSILLLHLWRHRPSTTAQVLRLAGWVMLIATVLSPATRIGYLLYPINFFVWAHVMKGADAELDAPAELVPATLGLEPELVDSRR
jgi:hypothetical protein